MAILATKQPAGFTLIELLVVIIIISIVASIAMLTMNTNQHKRFATDANQLSNVIAMAEEEALLRPAILGIRVNTHQIQFFEYQEKNHRWQPMTETILGLHTYDMDTQLTLKMNNEIILPGKDPQLIISANGDLTAFTLLIGKTHHKPYYQVTGEENGTLHTALIHE